MQFNDIAIKIDSPNVATVVGTITNLSGQIIVNRKPFYLTTQNSFYSYNTNYPFGPNDDSLGFDNVEYLPNGTKRILATDGIYDQSLTKIYSLPEMSPFTNQYGFKFINNNWGIAATNDGKIIETTNGGYNWITVSTSISGNIYGKSAISYVQGDIVYYGDVYSNNVYVRRLFTTLNSFFDNQSSSYSLIFDGTSYDTPTNTYLRGGISSLTSASILNSGQSSEKIFYKWNDGFMDANHAVGESSGFDFYFDMSGTTIANYYKTKQISSTSEAISTIGQTKVLKDQWSAINQIHQSIDGGIFYTKSYNNGTTYKSEEIVNATTSHAIADGNKNPSLSETKWYGTLTGGYPVNKNVAACWERYNSSSGTTEIKVAVRDYNIFSDTVFSWNS